MGRDNQAKDRQLVRKAYKEARRASYARILIVTEGSKTEPRYLEEIRAAAREPGRIGAGALPLACGVGAERSIRSRIMPVFRAWGACQPGDDVPHH